MQEFQNELTVFIMILLADDFEKHFVVTVCAFVSNTY